MKRLFFAVITTLLFFTSETLNAQNYKSKVTATSGQNVKYETNIHITDSIITIKTIDYELEYIVENKINDYYQIDQYGKKYNLTIAPIEGTAFRFKYKYAITLMDVNKELPPLIYYAIIE
ncbi:hypothetical protein ES692_06125 [Psychroserpens burtonensis]|uniref:DUF3244 domain-containing protein n=1 Tax=Psychroserpens burtonensis TaxID=49278 RepID=A0A5C7B915_9FLAO|nr:hypothetical protein [Psychroserpens burtonensis]TXE18618.1 hypothetical protein ES692_06125 [Psychroserpens burtonensis]